MDIQFKHKDLTYKGTVTTVPKDQETHYFIDLGESLQFTIRPSLENWETDNPDIEAHIVQGAAVAIGKAEAQDVVLKGEIINEPEDVEERAFDNPPNPYNS